MVVTICDYCRKQINGTTTAVVCAAAVLHFCDEHCAADYFLDDGVGIPDLSDEEALQRMGPLPPDATSGGRR
jgi:ribosome-binding protein aMBF1 (putative translation factor)